MPIYDFICLKCGHHFEELVRSPESKPHCSECRSTDTEKELARSFGIAFKASGFYATDYKRREWQENTVKKIAGKDKK